VGNNGTIPLTITVSNSYFANNGTNGILLEPNGSGSITASVDRSVFSNNLFAGINLLGQSGTGDVKAMVTDSVAANNKNGPSTGNGFLAQSSLNHSVAFMFLTRVTAVGNGVGISSFGNNAAVTLGQSSVTNNDIGTSVSNGATGFSYGDNYIVDNRGVAGTMVSINKS
jgi:hypothetical protein